MSPARKMPDQIIVGPITYDVVIDQAAIDRRSIDLEASLMGHHDGVTQELTLDPDLRPDQMAETLFHELLHAICHVYGVDLGGAIGADGGPEERAIRTLSPALVDTLRRNPELVRALIR